jgi:hypothetical protein
MVEHPESSIIFRTIDRDKAFGILSLGCAPELYISVGVHPYSSVLYQVDGGLSKRFTIVRISNSEILTVGSAALATKAYLFLVRSLATE